VGLAFNFSGLCLKPYAPPPQNKSYVGNQMGSFERPLTARCCGTHCNHSPWEEETGDLKFQASLGLASVRP
jgi:hypothetical protein